MEKQTNNNKWLNMFFALLMAIAIMLSNKLDAQTIAKVNISSKDSSANENVQVNYLGSTDDGVLFNVKYNNQTAAPFTIVVADASGEILYEQTYSDKLFDKKFLLSRAYDKMSFSIKSDKAKASQTFAVNISSKEIEDVYVRRN